VTCLGFTARFTPTTTSPPSPCSHHAPNPLKAQVLLPETVFGQGADPRQSQPRPSLRASQDMSGKKQPLTKSG
ncbi:MAG: hypothetical protein EB069_10595, partial [Actinobacteria bacterium]|nr:hypothetical protein [Actinomycetota bacterium]